MISDKKVHYDFEINQNDFDAEWEKFLVNCPNGHHVQSSLWSELKAIGGWDVVRLLARRESHIIGGIQILYKKSPLLGGIGVASNGPVIDIGNLNLMEELLTEIKRLMKSMNLQALFVQPPLGNEDFETIIKHEFSLSFQDLSPEATVLVDLKPDLDDILKKMKSKTRYNIRYAARNDVIIREGSIDDLPLFHKLLSATASRQQFTPYNLEYFMKMYELFNPAGHFKLLFAEHENDTIASILLISYGNTVIYKKGGWLGEKGNLHPNEALHWAAISWAKENGYDYYNFEGIHREAALAVLADEPIPQGSMDAPTRFKLGFGGNVVLLPLAHVYMLSPLGLWAYDNVFPKFKDNKLFKQILDKIR